MHAPLVTRLSPSLAMGVTTQAHTHTHTCGVYRSGVALSPRKLGVGWEKGWLGVGSWGMRGQWGAQIPRKGCACGNGKHYLLERLDGASFWDA